MLGIVFLVALGLAPAATAAQTGSGFHPGTPLADTAPSEYWICPRGDHTVSFSVKLERGRAYFTSPLNPAFVGADGDAIVKDMEWRIVSNTDL